MQSLLPLRDYEQPTVTVLKHCNLALLLHDPFRYL